MRRAVIFGRDASVGAVNVCQRVKGEGKQSRFGSMPAESEKRGGVQHKDIRTESAENCVQRE